MTPQQFIDKWGPGGPAYGLNEEQGAQSHFLDLCDLLHVPKPGSSVDYVFERSTFVLGESRGFADVFYKDRFAWENKAPGKNLDAALKQLLTYSLALSNPPILVVCDRLNIRVHTQFNGHPSQTHHFHISHLAHPEKRELLRKVWVEPESFRPKQTNRAITELAAHSFATLAEQLRSRGEEPDEVAHFLTQCLFCFFAEDVGLLPGRMFERLVDNTLLDERRLSAGLATLFETMRDGGLFGPDMIPWFNGGLFKKIKVPVLLQSDVTELRNACSLNWSAIDVSIFGTLFERGLDPAKRSELGAHYTDPSTIERVINPVIRQPLQKKWELVAEGISADMVKVKKKGDKFHKAAHNKFVMWLEYLKDFRVLDPACGSGNFLYLSLKELKNIEHASQLEASSLGLDREQDLVTGPQNLLGIETNEYAAELARVTVWIGELQWRIDHGYAFNTNPVLEPLDLIECRDALIFFDDEDSGCESEWPLANVIVGNPPFLGDKKMRSELGEEYTHALRKLYKPHVPGGADLVCFWFYKARKQIQEGLLERAGLVSTNSIRGGKNRKVVQDISESMTIFDAWSDEEWINDGAAVRVSIICFGNHSGDIRLNGQIVGKVHSDLSSHVLGGTGGDLTVAKNLIANQGYSYQGVIPRAEVKKATKILLGLPDATFNLTGQQARAILKEPATDHGQPMSDVIFPYLIADEITTRPLDRFIVNFHDKDEEEACLYAGPFKAISNVRLHRQAMEEGKDRRNWWQFARWRPEMMAKLKTINRYIAIPRVAKHHLCVWVPSIVVPDNALVVIVRDDDVTFGILQSRFHALWALRKGSALENRPRYTPTTCFDQFPFPEPFAPSQTASEGNYVSALGASVPLVADSDSQTIAERVADAAYRLNNLRGNYLNPPQWIDIKEEVIPLGLTATPYPNRIEAKLSFEKELSKRTLTNLYNESPHWLKLAHSSLNHAVAAAYGWADYSDEMSDDEILRRLLELNLNRGGSEPEEPMG